MIPLAGATQTNAEATILEVVRPNFGVGHNMK